MAGKLASLAAVAWLPGAVLGWPRVSAGGAGVNLVTRTAIGPPCTVGAHGRARGRCPSVQQPPPPDGSTAGELHTWPDVFVVEWTMAFDPNMSHAPPWGEAAPPGVVNITTGKTFYHVIDSEVRSMRETYDDFCIPVFGPLSSNRGGCSFVNAAAGPDNGTSYVLFDTPGLPPCCIIGRPFHPPPPDFAHAMPLHYRDTRAGGRAIDWNVVYDKLAGPFAYGFDSATGEPAQFYMMGVLASAPVWMVQRFFNFQPGQTPPPSTWDLPHTCAKASPCPGWEPDVPVVIFS